MAFGSDEKTSATQSLPKQRTFDASHDRSTGVPTEITHGKIQLCYACYSDLGSFEMYLLLLVDESFGCGAT
eukprot:scaffold13537_cov142-Skeletonema_marinoi.AAC.6